MLERALKSCRDAALARERVREALEKQGPGPVLTLEERYPWMETVIGYNRAHSADRKLFVVSPDGRGAWNLRTVPKERSGFEAEKDLPACWAGLRGIDLEAACGIEGAVFCHKARFLAVFSSLQGALRAAKAAADA